MGKSLLNRIIAYVYEFDYHCIDCTGRRFGNDTSDPKRTITTHPNGLAKYHHLLIDGEGNKVLPVYSTDEWEETEDVSFLADNPTQYLTCGTKVHSNPKVIAYTYFTVIDHEITDVQKYLEDVSFLEDALVPYVWGKDKTG